MLLLVVVAYILAAIMPALARSWRSWFILSGCALLPAALIAWVVFSSGDVTAVWLMFLMWCLIGIAIFGMGVGAFGVFGRHKGWKLASRPIPVIFAGLIATASLAYGAVATLSFAP